MRRGYDVAVPRRILLASPRGYCAGVERAVDTVEQALDLWGPPVYVRKQIVHNLHVVRDLEARGAVFVESETEVPPGATVVFSAHGVAPSVHENARARALEVARELSGRLAARIALDGPPELRARALLIARSAGVES